MDLSDLGNALGSPDQIDSVLIPVQEGNYTLYATLFRTHNGSFVPPNQLSFVFGNTDQEYEVIVDEYTSKDRQKFNVLKVIYNGMKYKINAQGSIDHPSFFIQEFIAPGRFKTWYGSFHISNSIPFRSPFVLQPAGMARVTVTSQSRAQTKSLGPRTAVRTSPSASALRGAETRKRNAAAQAAQREAAANIMSLDAGPSSREQRAAARGDRENIMVLDDVPRKRSKKDSMQSFGKVKSIIIKVNRDILYLKR